MPFLNHKVVGEKLQISKPSLDFLFFFHGYGFGGTRSHAGHAEDAVFCSDGNRFLSVWIFRKVLKLEDVDWTNIHADTVAVALGPVNLNLYHFCQPLIHKLFNV